MARDMRLLGEPARHAVVDEAAAADEARADAPVAMRDSIVASESRPAQLKPISRGSVPQAAPLVLEVLEVDILWPRWVARTGVTRSTQAWFLAADRQCTELPLLRLPRLVPEVARG